MENNTKDNVFALSITIGLLPWLENKIVHQIMLFEIWGWKNLWPKVLGNQNDDYLDLFNSAFEDSRENTLGLTSILGASLPWKQFSIVNKCYTRISPIIDFQGCNMLDRQFVCLFLEDSFLHSRSILWGPCNPPTQFPSTLMHIYILSVCWRGVLSSPELPKSGLP